MNMLTPLKNCFFLNQEKKPIIENYFVELPSEIIEKIFSYLPIVTITNCTTLCKRIKPNAVSSLNRECIKKIKFGKKKWEQYFGEEVGKEIPLPDSIVDILRSPCPFWKSKRIFESHMLIMIPERLNGKKFTLKELQKIVKKPRKGDFFKILSPQPNFFKEFSKKQIEKSYWILMTKDLLPESRNRSRRDQMEIVAKHVGYRAPKLIEATTSIFAFYYASGADKEMLFKVTQDSSAYTACKEKFEKFRTIVGGFYFKGLLTGADNTCSENIGIAPLKYL